MIQRETVVWKFYELLRLLSENKIDEDYFYFQIVHMDFADYRLHYCKARHNRKNNDYKAALPEIVVSLDLLAESSKIPDFYAVINMPTLMFPMPDSDSQWYFSNVSVATPADVYSLAGEINTVLGYESVSLQYYKMYLAEKSKIENYSRLNSLLSFRSSRNLKYLLDDLSNNCITVTRPSRMNDPMDSLFNIWRRQFYDVCREKKHTEILRRAFDYFRIRSFADNSDGQMIGNHAMWAHYANSHKGCCIEYDFSGVSLSGRFRKVHYAKTAPCIAGEKSLNSDILFCTKGSDWSYEKEVRLIDYNGSSEEPHLKIDLGGSSCVKAVYFGYSCSEQTIATVRKALKEHLPVPYKMSLDSEDIYKLVPITL